MPTRISGRPIRASVEAVRMSQAMVSSKPAPKQWPFSMHTVGNGASCTARMASWSSVMNGFALLADPRAPRVQSPPGRTFSTVSVLLLEVRALWLWNEPNG